MLNRYHYIVKNKLTAEIIDLKVYNLPNPPEEMAEIIRKSNEYQPTANVFELVTDPIAKKVVEFALKWKTNNSMEDVLDQLRSINSEVASISDEIRDHLTE